MRAEEKNMVERIMDTETMGYAYEYPYGGSQKRIYVGTDPGELGKFYRCERI